MASIKRKKTQAKRKNRRLRIIIAAVSFTLLAVLMVLFGGFVFVATATYKLPNIKSKQLFNRAQTTKIYDANGNLLTNLYAEQNRIVVPLDKISPYLQKAVIAVEDRRFYDHEGVDLKAIVRALLADVQRGEIVEGGSTLTQQFVKNTLITQEQTFQRKIREAALAFQVEKKFSKKQILEGYLNTIYFGHSAYSAETAAQTFFKKNAADLNIEEAALLAAVIRSPNNYSPYKKPELAKKRRNNVIEKMRKEKMISSKEASAASAAPIQVRPLEKQSYPAPYFVEYVKELMLKDPKFGSTVSERANTLLKGGLRIYTTIDPKLQKYAEDAVFSTLDQPNDPSSSLVALDPKTGYIRAMVGGRDWNSQKLNLATQAPRQPGSSFKPFVLAAAIQQGIGVSTLYQSGPAIIKLPGKDWRVNTETGGHSNGLITLRAATVKSINAVFARLIMDVGAGKVVDLVKKMGISSPVERLPAIALGGLGHGVTALDMATAYSTFANYGRHADTIAITQVTDADGKVLKDNKPRETKALDEATAYLVTDILKDVIRYGTGRRANFGRPAAGKTGTAEDYGDAWFVGYSPYLSTAVWVGYRDTNRSMRNVHGITVQGGTFPAEIWRKFMSKAHAGLQYKDFARPNKGLVSVKLCADMPGFLANEFCTNTVWGTFAKGTAPARVCDIHKAPPNIKVPNVIGINIDQAKQTLESAGFKYTTKKVSHAEIPVGQVASQNPAEGIELPEGSTIDLEVSKGGSVSSKINVPGVVGLSKNQAVRRLGSAGLQVSIMKVKVNDPSRSGKVVDQDPAGGSSVSAGSIVTISVGK